MCIKWSLLASACLVTIALPVYAAEQPVHRSLLSRLAQAEKDMAKLSFHKPKPSESKPLLTQPLAKKTVAPGKVTVPAPKPTQAQTPTPIARALPVNVWQTKRGVKVYFTPIADLPIVDINVVVKAGSAQDGAYPGLAALTSNMLLQGSKELTAEQIAQRLDNVGARLLTRTERDKVVFSLRSLAEPRYLQGALQTFNSILTRPTFPRQAFIIERNKTLQTLKTLNNDPQIQAEDAFYRSLYGTQAYAHPILGTPKVVRRLLASQARAFYQHHYKTGEMLVTIVGDIKPSQAKQLAEQLTRGIPSGKVQTKATPVHKLKPQLKHVKQQGEQTTVYLGGIASARNDKQYLPLLVAKQIMLNRLQHSLTQAVGEQGALVYNVDSQLSAWTDKGPLAITFTTRNDLAPTALRITRKLLKQYIKQGPSPQELTQAKDYLITHLPISMATNADVSRQLIDIAMYNLPINYYMNFAMRVQRVTRKDVQQALQQALGRGTWTTVSVGGKNPNV